MGIPAYFSHIINEHRSVLKNISTDTFGQATHLFLDSNSIIYDVIRTLTYSKEDAGFENDCIREICKQIQYYISLIKPTKMTMVAFDGVAPVAKLKQQQSRRYKTAYMKELFPKKDPEWNTSAITPGTKFMENLSVSVKQFFAKQSNVLISSSDSFGEGEHKIFDYIRKHENELKHDKIIIYGLDADLIMLTLQHLNVCPTMYLFRETPHFIKSIDKTLNPNELYALDIPELAIQIKSKMNTVPESSAISDYVFMSFLLGNDFIPHMPALNIRTNGIDRIFDAYKATITGKTSLTKGGTIHWDAFNKFLKYLAKNEYQYIKSEYELRVKQEKRAMRYHHNKTDEEKWDVTPQIQRAVEHYINPEEDGWQWRYYKSLTDVDIQHFTPRKICINYMEALEWTLHYYTIGCKNVRWYYHYMYPPLLEHLVQYTPSFQTDLVDKNHNQISADVQLAYVLPQSASGMLTPKMRAKMVPYYKKTTHLESEWAFCKYFWESHLKLPPLAVESLED
jgi:5'-3' exoribonuclease 1